MNPVPAIQPEHRAAHDDAAPILSAISVHKTYRLGRVRVPVLRGATLRILPGESVAVLGASGSGKSTLLHILGGLDRPDHDAGRVLFHDAALSDFSATQLDRYRARSVGFVFQFYHLLPELSVLENTLVPAMVALGRAGYRARAAELRARAGALLESFGLSHRLRHRPAELSGGERQRVAIARALINEPAVLLADEPTGNLDRKTGEQILSVLADLRRSRAQTIVTVTHDAEIAATADRVVHLVDGAVVTA